MIGIAIDALVLMVLLKTLHDEDIGFGTSLLVAIGTSIGTAILAVGLGMAMGIVGVLLAAILAAILLGVAVSALFEVEIKRAFLIGGIFMAVHICMSLGIRLMLS